MDAALNSDTLKNIHNSVEQWAATYTWQYRTYGAHSTQRSEAIHSSMTTFCNKRDTLTKLTKKVKNMSQEILLKSELDRMRNKKKLHVEKTHNNSVMNKICKGFTKYPSFNMRYEMSQAAMCYVIEDIDLPENSEIDDDTQKKYMVKRIQNEKNDCDDLPSIDDLDYHIVLHENDHITSMSECSCQFPNCYGYPCRHMFRLAIQLNWKKVRQLHNYIFVLGYCIT